MRGPSPRYCAVCGGKIAEMKPNSCVNRTSHISEVEWERHTISHTTPAPK